MGFQWEIGFEIGRGRGVVFWVRDMVGAMGWWVLGGWGPSRWMMIDAFERSVRRWGFGCWVGACGAMLCLSGCWRGISIDVF